MSSASYNATSFDPENTSARGHFHNPHITAEKVKAKKSK